MKRYFFLPDIGRKRNTPGLLNPVARNKSLSLSIHIYQGKERSYTTAKSYSMEHSNKFFFSGRTLNILYWMNFIMNAKLF